MPLWRTGSSPVPGIYMNNIIDVSLISSIYGMTLISFIASIANNYLYSSQKRDFLILFAITVVLIFFLSTLNLIFFFLNLKFHLWISDLSIVVVLLLVIRILELSFNESLFVSKLLLSISGASIVISSFLKFYTGFIYYIINSFIVLSFVFVAFSILRGIIKNDQNYLNSVVFFDYKASLVGILMIIILFSFKVLFSKELYNFVFYNFLFFVILLSLFFARLKFAFVLRDKLAEENQKFETLYRTMVDEMLVGKDIIDKLLPKKKNVKGLNFEMYFKPAILVGGDFIDVFKVSENKYVAYLADISGHGVSAGIIVSMLKALVLKEFNSSVSISSAIKVINDDFNSLVKETGRYATMFIALINKEKKFFEYVSCGHIDCLYWNSKINEFFYLSSTAPILGLLNKIDVYSSKIEFDDNDFLILISDGIFSIGDGEHSYFSQDDFIGIVKKYINPQIEPNEFVFRVVQDLEEVYAKGHVLDDISIL
ncbi:MAG: PP2C family protein-serine/threonine phosphatase, partial [Brevinematia bacterium]